MEKNVGAAWKALFINQPWQSIYAGNIEYFIESSHRQLAIFPECELANVGADDDDIDDKNESVLKAD